MILSWFRHWFWHVCILAVLVTSGYIQFLHKNNAVSFELGNPEVNRLWGGMTIFASHLDSRAEKAGDMKDSEVSALIVRKGVWTVEKKKYYRYDDVRGYESILFRPKDPSDPARILVRVDYYRGSESWTWRNFSILGRGAEVVFAPGLLDNQETLLPVLVVK